MVMAATRGGAAPDRFHRRRELRAAPLRGSAVPAEWILLETFPSGDIQLDEEPCRCLPEFYLRLLIFLTMFPH